jgi:hypothetical protein
VNVFHDVVIYTLNAKEGSERLIDIVFLNKSYTEVKVSDFSPDDSCKKFYLMVHRQPHRVLAGVRVLGEQHPADHGQDRH